MNYWHKIPRDFSFLYYLIFLPPDVLLVSVSSSSDWISINLGNAIRGSSLSGFALELYRLFKSRFSLLSLVIDWLYYFCYRMSYFWNASLYFYFKKRLEFQKIRITYNLCFYTVNYFIDSSPLVWVFCLSSNNTKAFENIYNIINASSFNLKFFCALIKKKTVFLLFSVNTKETST